MTRIPPQLHELAQHIHQSEKSKSVRVRELLQWFDAERRGLLVVREIRAALRKVKLVSVPDFEVAYIDQKVKLRAVSPVAKTVPIIKENAADLVESISDSIDAVAIGGNLRDTAALIGTLAAANILPQPVPKNAEVREAITRMQLNGHSHLPVMQSENDRDPAGIISWRSIGEARISSAKRCRFVHECMEEPEVIRWNTHLFDAIRKIAEKGAVLVRNREGRISGLVTTTDISLQFGTLSEPFLLLREIEGSLRRLIDGKFTLEEMREAHDPNYYPRKIESVHDLTFGEYVRLLERQTNWDKLQLDLSRKPSVQQLRETGRIRNDVMHFHPDPLTEEDMRILRETHKFLQTL